MSNLQTELAHFTGTENWHRFNPLMRSVLATDGVMYLAEKAQCFWLLDIVCFLRIEENCKNQEFITCKLVKDQQGGAIFTATNGSRKVLYTQDISFTDFPLDEITLYLIDNVILLPSEY